MMTPAQVVFLLDVDNTLFDNDQFAAELTAQLDDAFGYAERLRYWSIYGERRERLGFADYLGALQEFRLGTDNNGSLLQMSGFLLDYHFRERIYPEAFAAIKHLNTMGITVILSDGDIVFQPRKIQSSGLWDAVNGRVLVYVHKEQMLEAVQKTFPASQYVMVDDKPKILTAMKLVMAEKLTTVFVRQGHYAVEAAHTANIPPADVTVKSIGDLCNLALSDFLVSRPSGLAASAANP
jgi:FMN phosphatase YigB (HAD superfamily)